MGEKEVGEKEVGKREGKRAGCALAWGSVQTIYTQRVSDPIILPVRKY